MLYLSPKRYSFLLLTALSLVSLGGTTARAVPVPYRTKVSLDAATCTITGSVPDLVISSTVAPITQNGNKLEGNGNGIFKSTVGGAVAFTFKALGGLAPKDRSEAEVQSFIYGDSRYTAYNLYIPSWANSTGWLVFSQWWRSGPGSGGNMPPPAALELERNTSNLLVAIRNEENQNGVGSISSSGTNYVARTAIPRDTWIKVEVWTRFYVNTNTGSRFVVFITPQGGARTQVVSYTGKIGYANPVTGSFYHKVGLYRQGTANPFTLYMDDIKTDVLSF